MHHGSEIDSDTFLPRFVDNPSRLKRSDNEATTRVYVVMFGPTLNTAPNS
jgi:hypothetical protein